MAANSQLSLLSGLVLLILSDLVRVCVVFRHLAHQVRLIV